MTLTESGDLACGTETILLVDDDDMMRNFGKTLLEHLGYSVLVAADGAKGLEIFRNERSSIRLVILDLVLPLLSGEEVLEGIRSLDSQVGVIITSGYDAEMARHKIGDTESVHFLTKPCDIHVLAQKVREVIDNGRLAMDSGQ